MEGEADEIKNLSMVSITVLASLMYCHFISSKIPKGKLRFVSLLPIISIFAFLPLQFSSTYVFSTGIASSFLSYLANFKLLLFAFDQGPLSCQNSLVQFIFKTLLPVKINQNKKSPSSKKSSSSPKLPLNWPTKVLLFTILVEVLNDYKPLLNPNLVLVSHCYMVCLMVDIIFGPTNVLVHTILDMELESPSNEPYFSTSLQDFWGRRWNLMVTDLLRHTVFKPVKSCLGPVLGPYWASFPAVLAAFLVSGLMHELQFYHITRRSPSWEVTFFFVLQGVCSLVEFGFKRLFENCKWKLHWAVSGPLTLGFIMVTAKWLFFPPLMRTGADERLIEEFKTFFNFVREGLKLGS